MNKKLAMAFLPLCNQLSPENLNCDGEISAAEASRRYHKLMKEWKALEKKHGVAVTEDEVWAWCFKNNEFGH